MINDALDLDQWRARLQRDGRVQVDDYLQPSAAERLRACLEHEVPWTLALRDADGARTIDHASYAAMDPQRCQQLLAQVAASVSDESSVEGRFRFAYDSYMMVRAYQEGRDPGLPLHRVLELLNSPDYLGFARADRRRTRAPRQRPGHALPARTFPALPHRYRQPRRPAVRVCDQPQPRVECRLGRAAAVHRRRWPGARQLPAALEHDVAVRGAGRARGVAGRAMGGAGSAGDHGVAVAVEPVRRALAKSLALRDGRWSLDAVVTAVATARAPDCRLASQRSMARTVAQLPLAAAVGHRPGRQLPPDYAQRLWRDGEVATVQSLLKAADRPLLPPPGWLPANADLRALITTGRPPPG